MGRPRVDVSADARVALDALSLLSNKWHPVVVVALTHHGPSGFNELLDVIPDISGKVLSETLETLVEAELIERTVISESPLRVEYGLTSAGKEMEPIFAALSEWGTRHLETDAPTVLIADGDRRLLDMYGEWLSDQYEVVRAPDGRALESALEDGPTVVVFELGLPGAAPDDVIESVGNRCRTIALVGDRPTFDLFALECDDVLRKPIVRETALEAIETQLSRIDEPDEQRERAAITAKLSLFRSVYSRDTLESNPQYLEARSRLESLESAADE